MKYFFIPILFIFTNLYAEPVRLNDPDPAAAFAAAFGGEKISQNSFTVPFEEHNINLYFEKSGNVFSLVIPTIGHNNDNDIKKIISNSEEKNACLIFSYFPERNMGLLIF